MATADLKTTKSDAETRNRDDPSTPQGDSSTNLRDPAESEAPKEDLNRSKEGDEIEEDEDDEEEGECGFCLFMKGGGCKESFIAWENCIEEAEKNEEDIVTKCTEVTASLKKCMDAHADYYEPILRAEKAAQEEAKMELEREKAEEEAKKEAEGSKGNEGLTELGKKAES
ncbi:PREDICTED: uncharacterized protein LOC104824074 [Tarenaya hassleriana]|uniref:uncharacterized protein LOC104824074 n=1 Tax=Tarenaya hassleriana TaxID=28532 RepID=UPI00053C5C8B|nr:PREDICTED: uncharacterized protein LOC104824074 [Tarenaya hassleriana]